CDFTLVIEGEEEPDPVVDYDLSSLGKVHWEIGNNRFLTDITLQSSASKLVLSPIRGDGQSDLEKRNQVYHDHSDLVFAIEAGDVFHLLVNGGTINANYKNMPTYVYIDWGKDGFIYSTPSDYVDVETSIPHPDSDLVAHNGWSKDGYGGQHRDYNGEDVTSTPAFPYDFEIFIPEDTKPGKYRLRVKNAMCSLDPNGKMDFEDTSYSTIQRTGGTIVDFTIEVKEPGSGPVPDPIDPATLVELVNPVGTDLEWTVGTCCYEKVGESNGANGAVSQLTDGDKSNYWHSAYESASAPHTGHHYITFDIKEEREIGGFSWTSRTNAPAPDALEHGMLRSWEIYVADNADEFAFADNAAMEAYRASHKAAATGTCDVQYASNEFSVTFTSLVKGQYFLLVATEVGQKGSWISNDYEFLHCAEFSFLATPKPVDTVLAYNTFNQYLSWTISEFCCEEPTNEQPSGTIDKLIDNDPSTFYHSHWSNSDEPHGTHYFVVDLKKARDIYGFAWTPRQSDTNNGIWQTYHMFASDDKSAFDFGAQLGDKEYSNITARHTDLEAIVNAYVEENGAEGRTGTLSATGGSAAETAMFAKPLNGRYVLMVITESNRSLSCAAELGFYFEDTEELRDELNGGGGPSEEVMIAEIQAKLNAALEMIKTYQKSVPFANLDGAVAELEAVVDTPEIFLEDYEEIDEVLYEMIGAPVEEDLLSTLNDNIDMIWTLYQPGQNGYLCADTKSTSQGYDSFNYQSEADDNSNWTIVPSATAGQFYLRSAKGQYIGTPKQHYCRVDETVDEAGLFTFGVKDGYVTFKSVAFPGCGLGLDGKNDPAEIMTLEDGSLGYRWQVSVAETVIEPQPVAMTVTPDAGKVDVLSSISFYIADFEYAINTESTDPVTLTSATATLYSFNAEELAKQYDAKAQRYYIDCNLTENGTYTLTIPEATFKGETFYNEATVVVWTIEKGGIVSVTVNGEKVEAYDLQGRRVNNVTKGGLYIINGVKTLVK
ncbi:MAG: discoidin domain-containing protein, partial [Muribaculaceae bacterium]|nr:discoidin domain-containing protein [Muribaculaceae bacterium]